MEYLKYKNDGWGLSKKSLLELEKIIKSFNKNEKVEIVEFGSGISTAFLLECCDKYLIDFNITSYDHDKKYAFNGNHKNLNLKIVDLHHCSDDSFNEMFYKKTLNLENFKKIDFQPHTRQKNTFYDIKLEELPKKINLVLLDGSHGNGRSIAFLYLKENMDKDSFIFIDDTTHYDFESRLQSIFRCNLEKRFVESYKDSNTLWEIGGNYSLYKLV
jgi:hypothetical protein